MRNAALLRELVEARDNLFIGKTDRQIKSLLRRTIDVLMEQNILLGPEPKTYIPALLQAQPLLAQLDRHENL